MSNMIKDNMYIVEWRDHFSSNGWFDKDKPKIDNDFILKTVGFFVYQDKYYIHLAMTDGEHAYGDIMSILRNNIVSVTEIEEE